MDKPHLLLVEDDVHLLEGVQSVLELEGYTISTAENGALALQMLCDEQLSPDLIVSDIMMPVMDGLQFLREVRKEERFVAIPFIFLTAKGERADINHSKRLGVDDYIVKPFDTDDLLIAIESRLHRHRALGKAADDAVSTIKRNILNVLNHEFRTPLTYIVAYADMLNESSERELDSDEMLSFLHGVNSGALRLRRLVENFIQLVELETGEAKRTYALRKAPIEDMQSLFDGALDHLRSQSPDRDINPIIYEIETGMPSPVFDAEFLHLALAHLIDNAIKFSELDQPITLGARVVGHEVYLSVKDQGRGITDKEREKIWDIFYQINRAYYEDQGVGAGLPIVRGIVKLHGGRVEMDSAPEMGSTFTLMLPLESTGETVPEPA
jgi:two-component system, sensor histidine kinase and response regulator